MDEQAFLTRQRIREAKSAIRRNRSLRFEGEAHAEFVRFFGDMFANLAANGGKDRRAADLYVVRAALEACRSAVGASAFDETCKQIEADELRRTTGNLLRKQANAQDDVDGDLAQLHAMMRQLEELQRQSENLVGKLPETQSVSIEQEQWKFPVFSKPGAGGAGQFDGEFREFSALKMFGYTVGKEKGWSKVKRREFLSDFMEMRLPKEVEEIFGDEYGQPMSVERLRKMANLIANNASNALRRNANSMRYAISDWEADLEFLKEKYYREAGLRFHPWPNSKNR